MFHLQIVLQLLLENINTKWVSIIVVVSHFDLALKGQKQKIACSKDKLANWQSLLNTEESLLCIELSLCKELFMLFK